MEILRNKLGVMKAGTDLSAKQYYLGKVTGALTVGLCGAGEAAIGVIRNKPIAGEAVELAVAGDVSEVIAGANLTAGTVLASDANGKAVAATSGDYVVGVALNSASAGELVSVFLSFGGKV